MILFTTDQFSRKKKGIEIMKRLKKVFALLMAMIMVVSCVSVTAFALDEESTTPTERSYVFPGQQKLTIHAEESDHAYILYQIFKGTSASSNGTISNIEWGDSVVDPAGDYDFTQAIITNLKKSTLPDGTTNPVQSAFASLEPTSYTDDQGAAHVKSTAGEVAAALGNIGTEATAKDAVATIIEDVLVSDSSKTVKKDSNPTKTPVTSTVNDEEITTYNFVFDNIYTGYYLVDESFSSNANNTDKTYSRFMLQVASTDTRAEDKSQSAPLLDKKIVTNPTQADGSETAEADMNRKSFTEAAMGDSITFELASTVPDMTYYSTYYFIVTDTLSKGLTFNNDMVVKVGGQPLTRKDSTAWSALSDAQKAVTPWYRLEVTNNEDGTTTLKIVFHNFKQYTTGAAVDIHYTAELNDDAIVGWGKTSQNTNSAYLTYSNNPNYHYQGYKGDPQDPDDEDDPDIPNPGDPTNNNEGEEPVGVTPTQTVYVYTTSIDLTKTTSTGTPLSGAVFSISGTAINKVRIDSEKFVDLATATKTEAEGGYDFKADDSTVYYYRLKDGTYTSIAPADATSTTEYVSTTVTATEPDQEDTVTYTKYVVVSDVSYEERSEVVDQELTVGADGRLVLNGLKSGTYTITELRAPANYDTLQQPIKITIEYADPSASNISDGCTWRVGFLTDDNNSQINGGGLATVGNELPGIVKLTVKNVASNSLPTTGGIGTTIFYAVGGTMLLAAMVLLITKRRMNHNVK
jgi:fimbrial isopeptide formation D2 family protein/LPXTG-motif cell wall-anchored protein